MVERHEVFLEKARESLAGAESEYVNGRYNNCANRCYYASFHAAIYALERVGIDPRGTRRNWNHEALQGQFANELVNRRKVYSGEFRNVLLRNQLLRNTADYERHWVTEVQASRALRRTRSFVEGIGEEGGTA